MRQACMQAVERVLGRPLTQAEGRNIESRIRSAMRVRAGKNAQQWGAMSEPQRLIEAAKMAAQQFVFEAQKKKDREGLKAITVAKVDAYIHDQVVSGADTNTLDALDRLISGRNDFKNNSQSIENIALGMESRALARMIDVVDALRPGLHKMIPWENKAIAKQFVDALNGVSQNIDPMIAKAVKEYRDIVDELRDRFNAAGGMIGYLDNWDMPHNWSQWLAAKVGQQKWVDDMMQWVDRSKYINIEDDPALGVTAGSQYTDAQMRKFLEEAYMTVARGGKREERANPAPGGGTWANRHAEHRQIHLRKEAVYEAVSTYSEMNMLENVMHHVKTLARDVATVETFGPSADATFELMLQQAKEDALDAAVTSGGNRNLEVLKVNMKEHFMRAKWDTFTGRDTGGGMSPVADATIGKSMRAWQTITHLGNAATAALVTDPVFVIQMSHYLRLNHMQVFLNQALAFAPNDRAQLKRMGLLTETVMDSMQRFATTEMRPGALMPKLASWKLQLTGLHFLTEMRRAAFSVTMMDAIGKLTRDFQNVADLDANDVRTLKGKGVDQATWDIWRAAQLEQYGVNGNLLTPEAISKVQGFTKVEKDRAIEMLLASVVESANVAVIQPGLRERVHLSLGAKQNSTGGEIVKTITQFKSFPWAIMTRQWEAARAQPGAERFGAYASLFLMASMAGALKLWLDDLKDGKEPRSYNLLSDDPDERRVGSQNIISAMLTGGALGVIGDVFLGEARDPARQSTSDTLLGPTAADIGKVGELTLGNLKQAWDGDETDAGTEAWAFAQSNNPLNTWYTKSLMDRAIFNNIHEAINPGYVDRMMDRQYEKAGTEYWWNPGDVTDMQTPEFIEEATAQ